MSARVSADFVRPHAIPDEVEHVFAIGDVHGRVDELAALLAQFEQSTGATRRSALVFLGDVVDRGPSSREVVALVDQALSRWPGSVFCLGNHDDWFHRFLLADLDFEEEVDLWLMQGGEETLRSFGADPLRPREARESVLSEHPVCIDLLGRAVLLVTWRGFVFVHAGIDPAASLERQTRRTCLWTRAPFLGHRAPLPGLVVHGHTPQVPARPHVTENRISLDTGAFFSGTLTALEIDGARSEIRFWQSRHGGKAQHVDPVVLERGYDLPFRPDALQPGVFTLAFQSPSDKG